MTNVLEARDDLMDVYSGTTLADEYARVGGVASVFENFLPKSGAVASIADSLAGAVRARDDLMDVYSGTTLADEYARVGGVASVFENFLPKSGAVASIADSLAGAVRARDDLMDVYSGTTLADEYARVGGVASVFENFLPKSGAVASIARHLTAPAESRDVYSGMLMPERGEVASITQYVSVADEMRHIYAGPSLIALARDCAKLGASVAAWDRLVPESGATASLTYSVSSAVGVADQFRDMWSFPTFAEMTVNASSALVGFDPHGTDASAGLVAEPLTDLLRRSLASWDVPAMRGERLAWAPARVTPAPARKPAAQSSVARPPDDLAFVLTEVRQVRVGIDQLRREVEDLTPDRRQRIVARALAIIAVLGAMQMHLPAWALEQLERVFIVLHASGLLYR
jgi:hypothetical protein